MSAHERAHSKSIATAPTEREIRSVLYADPIWAAYAIGDLSPDYAPYCRWHIAEGTSGKGLALIFSRLAPPAIFAMGGPEGVALALDQQHELPERAYLLMRQEHLDAARGRYHLPEESMRRMWRMHLTDDSAAVASVPLPQGLRLRALDMSDSERMRRLYAHGGPYAPDAFDPYQVADGAFFGVTDAQGEVLASGGTHVVHWEAGVAAIGNMYTHPEHRGKGLGAAVLQAIVKRLLEGGVSTVVLNVDERNPVARRLYERHGFETYCPYLEGVAVRQG